MTGAGLSFRLVELPACVLEVALLVYILEMANNQVYNIFVGAETGLLKGTLYSIVCLC